MTDELFEEADKLLTRLEGKIDKAIELLKKADLDNPFGRGMSEKDGDISSLEEIMYELKTARNKALKALEA